MGSLREVQAIMDVLDNKEMLTKIDRIAACLHKPRVPGHGPEAFGQRSKPKCLLPVPDDFFHLPTFKIRDPRRCNQRTAQPLSKSYAAYSWALYFH